MAGFTLDHAVAAARAAKEATVTRGGIGADLVPALHLYGDHEFLAAFLLGGFERKQRLRTLSTIIALSDAPAVHFLHEAYHELSPALGGIDEVFAAHESMLTGYELGSLAQRFAAGDQRVVESVTVFIAAPNEPIVAAFLPYRYNGRKVVWLTPIRFDEANHDQYVDGDVTDAIQAGFDNRDGEGMTPTRISSTLSVSVVLPTRPPRNAPCPCGSGRKAKACCWT